MDSGIDLKTFIKGALIQIIEGVQEAIDATAKGQKRTAITLTMRSNPTPKPAKETSTSRSPSVTRNRAKAAA